MATTVISCEGQGKPWSVEEHADTTDAAGKKVPPTLTCPHCLLSNTELRIKVSRRSNKLDPPTLPQHDIEVEGTELRYLLSNGNFHVHSATCPQTARDLPKSDYATADGGRPGTLVATTAKDAILKLWDDQLREAADTDEQREDLSLLPDQFLTDHGYDAATVFHQRCLGKIEGFQTTKAKSQGSQGKRDARRMLATLMIEAMAQKLNEILETNLADTTQNTKDQRFVLAGMSNEEISRTASHWVHHLPADKTRWLASGFPAPDRSDWRDAQAKQTPDTPDTTETETSDDETED